MSLLRDYRHVIAYLLIAVAAAVGFYQMNELSTENERRISEQQKTIALLCKRGWTELDVVAAAQALVTTRLDHDLAAGDLQSVLADRTFLTKMGDDLFALYDQLTNKDVHCPGTSAPVTP